MKKLIFAVIIIPLLAATSFAEEDKGIIYGGFGGFNFGMMYLDQGEINDWLEDAGVDEFSSAVPIFGGSGHGIMLERILVGMRGGAFFTESSGDYIDAEMTGGFFLFDVGYAAINKRRWMLAPFMGIGGAGIDMNLRGDLVRFGIWEEPDSENARADDTQKADLGWGYMIGHAGLSFYHNVPFTPGRDSYGMVMFGLTFGGMMELTRSSYQDKDIINKGTLPTPSFNGAYVQLEILFGGGTTRYPEVRYYRIIEVEEKPKDLEPEKEKDPEHTLEKKEPEKTPPRR